MLKSAKRDVHVKLITRGFSGRLITDLLSDLGNPFTQDGEFNMADPKRRLQMLKSAKNEILINLSLITSR